MKILSIDFDYFIDANLRTRNDKFPDGEDCIDEKTLKKLWDYFYGEYPEIKEIGVIPEYNILLEYLREHKDTERVFYDSHKEIERLFDKLDTNSSITNVDFHSDNYISGGEKVDCANWVRIVKERYPDLHIEWIKREDSETENLLGVFPYEMTDMFELDENYDIIFLCFSPEWTPPHLRNLFEDLIWL